jgi:hypothetical protein
MFRNLTLSHIFIIKANDCFYIGSAAFEMQNYEHSLAWYKVGYELWKQEMQKDPIKLVMNRLIDAARKVAKTNM